MHRSLLLAVAVVCAAKVEAQVGHDPAHSPYRDITNGKSVTALYGDIGGDGGKAGVGPHNGRSFGGRFDLRLSAPIQFGLTVQKAELERFVVSADDSVATRKRGPVSQDLTMIELSMQLNLTGKKTWHRLAPFISGSVGWTHSTARLPSGLADSSGFRFGNKFYLAPSIGLRAFVTQNLFLRAEARQLFWKLNYPRSYIQEPAAQPSADPDHPNAVIKDGKRSEWEGGSELKLGLGFAF